MWPFSLAYPLAHHVDVASELALPEKGSEHGIWDYIIVGAGPAGCALASRLSEDPNVTVLLVERGGPAMEWPTRVPLISCNKQRPGFPGLEWPSADANNRHLDVLVGNGLGGGSLINAMMYTRGTPGDYNRWSANGRKGWSYEEVEPYFRKSEGHALKPTPKYHGTTGPWKTRLFGDGSYLPSSLKCIEAVTSIGIPLVNDIHDPEASVVSCSKIQVTIDDQGRRFTTADAFLPLHLAVERKDRLKICTNALVTSIDIKTEFGDHNRAAGIFFQPTNTESSKTPRSYYARARREIVVCCGAITSPQLLMLSGVGPKGHLEEFGIKVRKDLPGVGNNLQDHVAVPVVYNIPMADSFVPIQSIFVVIRELLRYLFTGRGFFLASIVNLAIFVRTALLTEDLRVEIANPSQVDANLVQNIPDIEIMPIAHDAVAQSDDPPRDDGVFSLFTVLLQPRSKGSVRLISDSAADYPIADFNFFSHPDDIAILRKGVRLAQKIAAEMRRGGYRMTPARVPANDIEASDEDVDAFILKKPTTAHHFSSTCRMAPEFPVGGEEPGVVDDRLRVYGVDGLRVADCSILPDVISSHTQAVSVMVGEKCADMMKEDAKQY